MMIKPGHEDPVAVVFRALKKLLPVQEMESCDMVAEARMDQIHLMHLQLNSVGCHFKQTLWEKPSEKVLQKYSFP